jgi:hypothetical protein
MSAKLTDVRGGPPVSSPDPEKEKENDQGYGSRTAFVQTRKVEPTEGLQHPRKSWPTRLARLVTSR